MDDRPDVIERQIARTRDRLGRDLDRLDTRMEIAADDLKAQAQWWAGVSAVAAGAIGVVAFWPRGSTRRTRRYRAPAEGPGVVL